METIYRVENRPELIRDPYSKAILNTDRTQLMEHRKRRLALENNKKRLDKLEGDIDELKNMVSELIKMNMKDS